MPAEAITAEALQGMLARSELREEEPGLARLREGGRVLLELRAGEMDAAGFAALLERLRAALRPAPPARAVVVYREGLLGPVTAEVPLELLFIEEDPHDTPAVQLRRRRVDGDPGALRAALAEAERQGRVPSRAKPS